MWWWCKIRSWVITKEMAIHLERAWKFSSNFMTVHIVVEPFVHKQQSWTSLWQYIKSQAITKVTWKHSGKLWNSEKSVAFILWGLISWLLKYYSLYIKMVDLSTYWHYNLDVIPQIKSLSIFCFYWIFFFLTIFSTVRTYVVMFSWPWLSIIFLSTTTSISTLSLWLCWFFIRTALLFLGMNLYSSGRIKMSPSGGLGMSE